MLAKLELLLAHVVPIDVVPIKGGAVRVSVRIRRVLRKYGIHGEVVS